ncbi:MAG TPA: hypothetical protein DGP39_06680, partial [Verrucomicrobiales bacterium]|nr:hypothetical protein [Verrucomicrobiales bacterium]
SAATTAAGRWRSSAATTAAAGRWRSSAATTAATAAGGSFTTEDYIGAAAERCPIHRPMRSTTRRAAFTKRPSVSRLADGTSRQTNKSTGIRGACTQANLASSRSK